MAAYFPNTPIKLVQQVQKQLPVNFPNVYLYNLSMNGLLVGLIKIETEGIWRKKK